MKLSKLCEEIIGFADTKAVLDIHLLVDSTYHSDIQKFRHGEG
mgnify:CR=1 FL=1